MIKFSIDSDMGSPETYGMPEGSLICKKFAIYPTTLMDISIDYPDHHIDTGGLNVSYRSQSVERSRHPQCSIVP